MKVLHICCNWAGPAVFESLCAALAQQGLSQTVYAPLKTKTDPRPDPGIPGLTVVQSPVVRPWDRLLYHTKARRALPDLLSQVDLEGVDLVHAHTLFTDGGIAYRLHKDQGLPYVVTVRNTDLEYFYPMMPHLRGHALRMLRAARAVHFLSPAYRNRLLENYIPAANRQEILAKSVVIPNGIFPDWIASGPKSYTPGAPVRITFAGKLDRHKHPEMAVAAASALADLLPDRQVTLALAGQGPLRPKLAALPAVASGQATLLGHLPSAELRALLEDSTLFLVPSARESFGLVYLEAMAYGLPVFWARGQAIDGWFPPGTAGTPIDPLDPAGMAQAMKAALGDYDAISARNLHAVRDFTWDQVSARFLRAYNEILSNPTGQEVL